MFAIFTVFQSVVHIINNNFSYRYVGRFIVSFPIAFFFLKAMVLNNTVRTSTNLPYWSVVISIGLLISIIGGVIYENNEIIGSSPS